SSFTNTSAEPAGTSLRSRTREGSPIARRTSMRGFLSSSRGGGQPAGEEETPRVKSDRGRSPAARRINGVRGGLRSVREQQRAIPRGLAILQGGGQHQGDACGSRQETRVAMPRKVRGLVGWRCE